MTNLDSSQYQNAFNVLWRQCLSRLIDCKGHVFLLDSVSIAVVPGLTLPVGKYPGCAQDLELRAKALDSVQVLLVLVLLPIPLSAKLP